MNSDIKSNSSRVWASTNPILRNGEPGFDKTLGRLKIGDGRTRWSDLTFITTNLPDRLSDGVLRAVYARTLALARKPLLPFLTAATQAQSAPVNIMGIGCSHMEGAGAGAFGARYIDVFLDGLRRRFQPSGVTGGRGYLPAHYSEFSIPGPATVVGSPDGGNAGFGLGGRSYYIPATGAGVRFDVAAPVGQLSGTSFDVAYLPLGDGGTFDVIIDGVPQAPLSTVGPQVEFATARYTFPAPGAHDVTITKQAGSHAILTGVIEYDGDEDAGLRYYDASHFGWSTADYVGNLLGVLSVQVGKVQPALVVSDLHVNNFLNNVSVADTRTHYGQLIDAVNMGATVDPTVLLVHPFTPAHSGTPAASWAEYGMALRQIQASYPGQVEVADLSGVMPGGAADTTGLYQSDDIHHTAKGHTFQGVLLDSALT